MEFIKLNSIEISNNCQESFFREVNLYPIKIQLSFIKFVSLPQFLVLRSN